MLTHVHKGETLLWLALGSKGEVFGEEVGFIVSDRTLVPVGPDAFGT